MFNSKKVILEARGGLGNQMFELAAARSFAYELNADLFIDNKIGFFLDFKYKRKFELDNVATLYHPSSLLQSYPFYLERLRNFLTKSQEKSTDINLRPGYLFERGMEYIDLISYDRSLTTYWMSGYFQDPRYFLKNKELILKEFLPEKQLKEEIKSVQSMSRSHDLIGLGFRMYEESSTPSAHAKDGKLKSVSDYQRALDKVLSVSINPKLLIFSTSYFKILEKLKVPRDTLYINSDTVHLSSYEKLKMLALCKHHVFNNSTFYWWGAFLSGKYFDSSDQQIFCSDNFLNSSIALENWNSF